MGLPLDPKSRQWEWPQQGALHTKRRIYVGMDVRLVDAEADALGVGLHDCVDGGCRVLCCQVDAEK